MATRTPILQEQDIVARYQNGEPASEITRKLAVGKTLVYSVLKRSGIKVKHPRAVLTEIDRKEIAALYMAGNATVDIAQKHRCSLRTVICVIHSMSLQVRPAGRRPTDLTSVDPHQRAEAIEQRKQEHRDRAKKYYRQNPAKMREKNAKYYAIPQTRILYLLQDAQRRSIRPGFEFDERLFDLAKNPPTLCACCSVTLKYDRRDVPRYAKEWRSPSIDRVNNNEGYVLGNVAITCWGCNYAKRNMSLETLKILVAYIERETTKRVATASDRTLAAPAQENQRSK